MSNILLFSLLPILQISKELVLSWTFFLFILVAYLKTANLKIKNKNYRFLTYVSPKNVEWRVSWFIWFLHECRHCLKYFFFIFILQMLSSKICFNNWISWRKKMNKNFVYQNKFQNHSWNARLLMIGFVFFFFIIFLSTKYTKQTNKEKQHNNKNRLALNL